MFAVIFEVQPKPAAPVPVEGVDAAAACELLRPFLDDRENPRHRTLCLIGVRTEKLSQ